MTKILISIIIFYKKFMSPLAEVLMGKACRFTPTCSEYTIESLKKYGASRGLVLGLKRFLKCHPWGAFGYDPVPDTISNKL